MKNAKKAVTTVLLLTVLLFGFTVLSLTGCDGGGFVDPGAAEYYTGGGTGGGILGDGGAGGGYYGGGGYGGGEYGGGYGGGTGGTGGGYGGGTGGGSSGWPPQSVRNQYGIGGLNQPPGSGFVYVTVNNNYDGYNGVGIGIMFKPTNQTPATLNTWFTSNGWKAAPSQYLPPPDYAWVKSGTGTSYMADYMHNMYDTGYADLTVVKIDGEFDDDDWW